MAGVLVAASLLAAACGSSGSSGTKVERIPKPK